MLTVPATSRNGNVSGFADVEPSPSLRVFTARLAYKTRNAGKIGPDTAEYLLAYIEGLVKDGVPICPEELAKAAEDAVRLGVTR